MVPFLRSRLMVFALGLASVAVVRSVGANEKEEKETCIAGHLRGQALRDEGKLRASRRAFIECSAASCPIPVRKDCAQWFDEIDKMMPTVVFDVRGLADSPAPSVLVKMDDEVIAERLTGMSVAVDPGDHVFYVIAGDQRSREEHLLVTTGQKNVHVAIEFPPVQSERQPGPAQATASPPAGEPRSRIRMSPGVYFLGALGLASLASFTYFGLRASSDGDRLSTSCAPRCPMDEVQAVRRDALVADISLGVAAVALGAGAWLLFSK